MRRTKVAESLFRKGTIFSSKHFVRRYTSEGKFNFVFFMLNDQSESFNEFYKITRRFLLLVLYFFRYFMLFLVFRFFYSVFSVFCSILCFFVVFYVFCSTLFSFNSILCFCLKNFLFSIYGILYYRF